MSSNPRLQGLAKLDNWIAFGKALSAAMDDPAAYACSDPSHLLAAVAQIRGVDPSSLRNPLSAVNWMEKYAPEALEEGNQKVAMTGVLTLSQISILSSDLAENLAPRYLSGEMSRRQLQTALRDLEASQGGRGVAAHERIKRRCEFEDHVFRYLTQNPEALEMGADVEVVQSPRGALVPSDFTVLRNGTPIAVIECKSHRNKLHRRYLVELLAMAALQTKVQQQAILVIPPTWGSSIEELLKLIQDLGLSSVRIAVFGQGDAVGEEFRMLGPRQDHV